MDKIAGFFGGIVAELSPFLGGIFQGVAVYAILCALIGLPVSRKKYGNIPASRQMVADLARLKSKYGCHLENSGNKLKTMFSKYGYSPFASVVCFALQMLFGLGLGIGFRWERLRALSDPFPGFSLARSAFACMWRDSAQFIFPLFLLAFAVLLQAVHDHFYEKDLVVNERAMDNVFLALNGAVCFFLPAGVSLYWIIQTLCGGGLLFAAVRRKGDPEKEAAKQAIPMPPELEKKKRSGGPAGKKKKKRRR